MSDVPRPLRANLPTTTKAVGARGFGMSFTARIAKAYIGKRITGATEPYRGRGNSDRIADKKLTEIQTTLLRLWE